MLKLKRMKCSDLKPGELGYAAKYKEELELKRKLSKESKTFEEFEKKIIQNKDKFKESGIDKDSLLQVWATT